MWPLDAHVKLIQPKQFRIGEFCKKEHTIRDIRNDRGIRESLHDEGKHVQTAGLCATPPERTDCTFSHDCFAEHGS